MPKERLKSSLTTKRKGPESVYATLQDLIKMQLEAKGFSFLPKYAVQSILSGKHRSKLRGRGLDFDEVRQYILGDDIRNIDWKVTARTGVTHTKEFTEERERPVFFIVDQSQSMFFGSELYFKSVITAHLTALGCWRTLDVGDRVGGIVFSDTEDRYIKPQRNRKTVQQFLSQVAAFNEALELKEQKTEEVHPLRRVLSKANQLVSHDYLVVVITDLYKIDDHSVKEIIQLKRNNDVILIAVTDPMEYQFNADNAVVSDGYYRLKIKEKSKLIRDYNNRIEELTTTIQTKLKKYGIPFLSMNTTEKASSQLRNTLSTMRGN